MTAELLDRIRADLPEMPEDVAAQWLAPHAARPGLGWPPPEDGRAEPWARLLAGRPVSWWRERLWHKEALPITFEHMSHATRFQVTRMRQAAEAGRDYLPDSRRRIAAVRAHLEATGTWPVAPVAYPDSDGLSFIDGFHRLAALLTERSLGRVALRDRHAVWIALPRKAPPDRTG